MATALVIGGWFAQSYIQTLLDKVGDQVVQQIANYSGIDDALGQLRTSLLKVRTILNMAKERKKADESLAALMKQLKDAAYDAEDLLGEIQYHALKEKIKHGGDHPSNFLSSTYKSAKELLVTVSNDVGPRMKSIQNRFDTIAAAIKDIIELLALNDGGRQASTTMGIRRLETTSFLTEAEVFGRDEERERVVELLLTPSSGSESNNSNITVLPLTGIGGVGKTTLAQQVFNDERIKSYFDHQIWICISHAFDPKRIIREVIDFTIKNDGQSFHGSKQYDFVNLDMLHLILKEQIMAKKVLLVLDDMWSEDTKRWETLFSALLKSQVQDGKILVTTRSKKIANMVGAIHAMPLQGLDDGPYWEFFKKYAFGSQKFEDYPHLVDIGKKIAIRLQGSPLAARTLGRLLSSNLDERHWTAIMDREIWELPQEENDIIPVLRLSYQYLPEHLKQCFAYSSVFPKRYKFEKYELIGIWIAQGFILPQRNMLMEDIGSHYLHDLDSLSFFQKSPMRQDVKHATLDQYVMHDLLHDLAQSIYEGEFARIEDGKLQEISTKIHHLSVFTENSEPSKITEASNYNKLRTIIIHRTLDGEHINSILTRVSSIRVLRLQRCGIKQLPDNIGRLIHLRYLDISFNYDLDKLPESLCRLYNLQYLLLLECPIKEIPKGICNLINLRRVYGHEDIISMIPNISKLSSLQYLPIFKVLKEKGHRITELRNMSQLHKLGINFLQNVDSKEEARQAMLENKAYLEDLTLSWESERETTSRCNDLELQIIEGLQPHRNLQSLTVRGYNGVISPNWLQSLLLLHLKTIFLEFCRSLGQLPHFAGLPHLKYLHMEGMHAVKKIGDDFHGERDDQGPGFPKLEELHMKDMPQWEEWSIDGRRELFPCLRVLKVTKCLELKALPFLPASLEEVELDEVGLTVVPGLWISPDRGGNNSNYSGAVSLSQLTINNCPNLTSLDEGWLSQDLPNIKAIKVTNCDVLAKFPTQRFREFTSLKKLRIESCCSLFEQQSEDVGLHFPPSLKELSLRDCGRVMKSLPDCLHTLTSLTFLSMWDCPHITSLSIEWLCHLTQLNALSIGKWQKLRSIEGILVLKSLKYLSIHVCPELTVAASEAVPSNEGEGMEALPLIDLFVDDSALLKLTPIRHSLQSLGRLCIVHSCKETIFEGEEEELLHSLKSLERLHFHNCQSLRQLPRALLTLPLLKDLKVIQCPEIQAIPQWLEKHHIEIDWDRSTSCRRRNMSRLIGKDWFHKFLSPAKYTG